MRRYYFIRHGKPTNEAASFRISGFRRDMLGLADEPLTDEGRAQARAVAPGLLREGVAAVHSSELRRAQETAAEISSSTGLPLAQRFPELNELAPGETWLSSTPLPRWLTSRRVSRPLRRRLGPWIGMSLTVHHLLAWRLGFTQGGDAPEDMTRRIGGVLSALDAQPLDRVACVGHGYWILLMCLTVAKGMDRLAMGRWVPHCSVTRIDADGRGHYEVAYFARPEVR